MFIKSLKDVEKIGHCVNWGAGTSHRLVVDEDNLGFTICHTVVYPKTQSFLEYDKHLEACYCIEGEGEIEDECGNKYSIKPGTVYGLDQHDKHILRNNSNTSLILISVFNPPLKGNEIHNLDNECASGY